LVESPLTLKGPHVIIHAQESRGSYFDSTVEDSNRKQAGVAFYIVMLKMLLLPPYEEEKIILVLLKSL
jgi:hypothetical protein